MNRAEIEAKIIAKFKHITKEDILRSLIDEAILYDIKVVTRTGDGGKQPGIAYNIGIVVFIKKFLRARTIMDPMLPGTTFLKEQGKKMKKLPVFAEARAIESAVKAGRKLADLLPEWRGGQ